MIQYKGKRSMERRKFLIRSSQLSMSVAASSMLVGCSGSSSDPVAVIDDNVSEIDQKIIDLDVKQAEISTAHAKMQDNLTFSDTGLYANTIPNYSESSVFPENYLSSDSSTQNLWENAKNAHQIAYDQYNHQYTKLKASLRLFDHQQNNSEEAAPQAKSVGITARREDLAEDDPLYTLIGLIESLNPENLGSTVLLIIEESLALIYTKLKAYIDGAETQAIDYAYLTYTALETLLNLIKEKALSELTFETTNEVLTSLARITVASIALIGLISLENLKLAREELSSEQEATQAFLTSNSLDGTVTSVWMGVSSKITLGSIDALKENMKISMETGEIPDNTDLIAKLKSQSQILAITAVTIKELFAKALNDGIALQDSTFTEGSTADAFKILFTSDKSPYDEALSKVVYANPSTFETDVLEGVVSAPAFEVSTSPEARAVTTDVESEAYIFATELASLSYDFIEITTPVDFATHLADLAYQFAMQGMEYGYEFAMQGMEYGYLFASRGEEVGIMADRILWMAVQIGVMADRIGEMADRIVYTAQLIVYTEILILDFGMLIYGFGSMITNVTLTGLAIIFDREWYTYEANNEVLEIINSNVMVMLANLQEYALAVLEHQNGLRDSTLDGLDPLPYGEL